MNAETIAPTLETCRRLEAAGFPQETLLRWRWVSYDGDPLSGYLDDLEEVTFHEDDHLWIVAGHKHTCAAPTFEEVARRLPPTYKNLQGGSSWMLTENLTDGLYSIGYGDPFMGWDISTEHASAAEAAALLWLAVHEKVQEVEG